MAQAFTWHGIRYLQDTVTYTFVNGKGSSVGGAWTPLALGRVVDVAAGFEQCLERGDDGGPAGAHHAEHGAVGREVVVDDGEFALAVHVAASMPTCLANSGVMVCQV